MSKRRMLYGYYIQQGEIAIVETEAIIVRRVFSLCIGGLSYQKISDLLNAETESNGMFIVASAA